MNAVNIDLSALNYAFQAKPLLVGGKAMAFYGLRKAGADIDFVISTLDYERLALQYPDHTKDLFGDLCVCVFTSLSFGNASFFLAMTFSRLVQLSRRTSR